AGNAGTHIHFLSPVDLERRVWHIGYQDVAAVGRLLRSGRLDVQRVVALAGPGALRPRLLRTRIGASIDGLTRGEIAAGPQRVVSGSVLDGRTAAGEVLGYLGRHHQQVSVVGEAVERELFGWIAPGRDKFSIWGVVLGAWRRNAKLALTTTTNGGPRAMVPIGSFERVVPLDLMPTFLLRALLMGNDETAESLGCLELDEDDLALCTFVCPGKAEYGPLLRAALTRIEKESA
ncbi:MAG: NADH:ubiquinone reductase (Na(+)-transporting) subunit A, partial [Rubrivivax sp.]